ncbi:hypothetical protein, partial [Burkholderia cenocepacia]|uniref:hypothetical protein n=1 Tax=Burkholderia cenocepacia TaxID=95486 RepID=UPI0015C55944
NELLTDFEQTVFEKIESIPNGNLLNDKQRQRIVNIAYEFGLEILDTLQIHYHTLKGWQVIINVRKPIHDNEWQGV